MRFALVGCLALVACGDDGPQSATSDANGGAVVGCPPIGTAPRFAPEIHIVRAGCRQYSHSTDANLALASCADGLREGPIDSALPVMAEITPVTAGDAVGVQQLFPEGDRLLAFEITNGGVNQLATIYERTSTGWVFQTDTGLVLGQSDRPASVTAGSPRRLFVLHENNMQVGMTLQELVGDGASWTDAPDGVYNFGTDLGEIRLAHPPHVTPDGLRMVFFGIREFTWPVWYTDRPTVNDRFRPAVQLDDVDLPNVQTLETPFLSPDCSRIHFDSRLGATVYQQQM